MLTLNVKRSTDLTLSCRVTKGKFYFHYLGLFVVRDDHHLMVVIGTLYCSSVPIGTVIFSYSCYVQTKTAKQKLTKDSEVMVLQLLLQLGTFISFLWLQ